MFGIFSGEFFGDILGYLIVVSVLFLPVVLLITYGIYEVAAHFPWKEAREDWAERRALNRTRQLQRATERAGARSQARTRKTNDKKAA